MIGASFDSTKTPLHDLLARADGGKLQLPDFQRGWVWDDDREDALLSVPEDRQVKAFGGEITLDLTTPGREYDADLFPVNRIFESAEWRQAYSEHWNFDRDKMRLF